MQWWLWLIMRELMSAVVTWFLQGVGQGPALVAWWSHHPGKVWYFRRSYLGRLRTRRRLAEGDLHGSGNQTSVKL